MQVLSPLGSPLPLSLRAATRPAHLDGLRIGLLDNTKAPVDQIMQYLAERLGERAQGASFLHVAKRHPSMQAERQLLEDLARKSDVVVNALGD